MATRMVTWAIVTALLVAGRPALAGPGRAQIGLNGDWEVAPATSIEGPPDHADWKPFRVPGCVTAIRGERSWFRRRFVVPAEWAGQRVVVVYDGVKFNSRHCGDEAYRDYTEYAQRAIGRAWSFQTRAYRASRVSGLCPWTCAGGGLDPATDAMAAAQAESMRPLAAFVKESSTRFHGGRQLRRTLQIMNDTLHGGVVTVHWAFIPQGAAAEEGTLSYALEPAEFREAQFEFTPPVVERVTAAELVVRASLAGTPDFEDRIPCKLCPPPRLRPLQSRLGLLAKPGDGAIFVLTSQGLAVAEVPALDAIPAEIGILIIGRDALPEFGGGGKPVLRVGGAADPYHGLTAFVRRGGRVLLLAQTRKHVPLGPVRFTPRQATITFPLAKLHPALASLGAEDLRFWAPDHIVADAQLTRAACGLRSLVVSGAESGLDYTALAEGQCGSGALVACGLRLVEALCSEPAAGILLDNLLQYLDRWQPAAGSWAAVMPEAKLAGMLASLDLDVPVVGNLADLPAGPRRGVLLGADADEAVVQRALDRVGGGGMVWWHRPNADAAGRWLGAHGLAARLASVPGPVRLAEGDPFTDGLARADLYWIQEAAAGAHGGPGVPSTPPSSTMLWSLAVRRRTRPVRSPHCQPRPCTSRVRSGTGPSTEA